MSFEIRLPNISGNTPELQLAETQSYLRQLVEYLNWAFNSIVPGDDTSNSGNVYLDNGNGKKTVDSKKALETFNLIKDLIINSADIVEAYEHSMKINVDGGYRALSDFGEYVEALKSNIELTSRGLEQTNARTQAIRQSGTNQVEIVESKAYLKTGFLSDMNDYGIELGKYDNNNVPHKYARFTTDKLSFYSGDMEVAWFSNRVLHIQDAILEHKLKVGNYAITQDRGGLAFLWEGDSGGNS